MYYVTWKIFFSNHMKNHIYHLADYILNRYENYSKRLSLYYCWCINQMTGFHVTCSTFLRWTFCRDYKFWNSWFFTICATDFNQAPKIYKYQLSKFLKNCVDPFWLLIPWKYNKNCLCYSFSFIQLLTKFPSI